MKNLVLGIACLFSVSVFAVDGLVVTDEVAAELETPSSIEVAPFVEGGSEPDLGFIDDEVVTQEIPPLPDDLPVLEPQPVEVVDAEPELDPLDAIAEFGATEVLAPVVITDGNISLKTAYGTSLNAYVAGPLDADKAILILHDRWGVDKTVKAWVQRFADKGYRALAVDVFDGRISKKGWLADEILNATDPEVVKANIRGGLNYLKAPERKIVTLGAGFGGWQSFQASLNASADVAATVVIYGQLEGDIAQFRSLKAPLLAVYASKDPQITWQMIDRYRVMMKKSFIVYRTYRVLADHGFMDPAYSTAYDEVLADEVWQEIDNFLAAFVELEID